MAAVLLFLTYLGIILLIGLLTSILSNKLKIPHILLLLLIGIALGKIKYKEGPLIFFPELFLTGISILALVMIVFDAASKTIITKARMLIPVRKSSGKNISGPSLYFIFPSAIPMSRSSSIWGIFSLLLNIEVSRPISRMIPR